MPDRDSIPIIDLSEAPGRRAAWDRPLPILALWFVVEFMIVTNPLQASSRLRVSALRLFGADIGRKVIFRPRTRVKFPWKLHIGDRSWVGEGAWFHNQDHIYIGCDAVISQDVFLTTGSHTHRRNMALVTRPIVIKSGAWLTSRCVVLGGTVMGASALARPLTVVSGEVPANSIVSGHDCRVVGSRFEN